jgi:hypothetical protein
MIVFLGIYFLFRGICGIIRFIYKEAALFFSLLYVLLLGYNLFAGEIAGAAISFCAFLITSPLFFKETKVKYPAFITIKKITNLVSVILLAIVLFDARNGLITEVPPAEQMYIDSVLSQITSQTTKAEAIELLGEPDRDLFFKVNWWVSIEDERSRIGIIFSPKTGFAAEIILDGGVERFYYSKELTELIEMPLGEIQSP